MTAPAVFFDILQCVMPEPELERPRPPGRWDIHLDEEWEIIDQLEQRGPPVGPLFLNLLVIYSEKWGRNIRSWSATKSQCRFTPLMSGNKGAHGYQRANCAGREHLWSRQTGREKRVCGYFGTVCFSRTTRKLLEHTVCINECDDPLCFMHNAYFGPLEDEQ